MRLPAVLLALAAIGTGVGMPVLAQAVAVAPARDWWEVWGKVIAPPIITGLIAVTGFLIAFWSNNAAKKREILYKEQLESVKEIIGDINVLVTWLGLAAHIDESYKEFSKGLNEYDIKVNTMVLKRLPLLFGKSRRVVVRFSEKLDELGQARAEINLYNQTPRDDDRDKVLAGMTEKYEIQTQSVVDYSVTVTDVLYRDLRFPGRQVLHTESLKEFDEEYKKDRKEYRKSLKKSS
ncbi:hypothetical protein Q0M94_19245 (plasmid) [Deinococcus radiomollis]|uniref:hypothetical protein n=1 Tax=Deinococcus radiomollis TaxID=468916 RepID=UPI003891ED23